MTGCVWEMQIKYCYALSISWALQVWEKLNVLWFSQCPAPLPYYLYLISHSCNHKRQMEQSCNKKNTREGWDVSYSFRAHTNSACAITQVLLHNRNCTQELKALWDSLGKEETKDTLPQRLWSSHGVLPGHSDCPGPHTMAGVQVTSWELPLRGDPAQIAGQRSRCPKQVQFADPSCCLWRFQRPPLQTLPQSCQLNKQMEHTCWWTLLYLPGHFQRQGHVGSLPKPHTGFKFQHLLHY